MYTVRHWVAWGTAGDGCRRATTRRRVATLAAAATAAWAAPAARAGTIRTWTGGASGNGTGWFTAANWSGGVYAGSYANDASAAKGAVDDVALFTGAINVSGVGVNFTTVTTAGGNTASTPFQTGAIVSSLTGLSGTSTALAIGSSATTLATPSFWNLNGSTVNFGATG
ncbi:MAG: hypothetical protein JWO31_3232, partial [Phycisphaerales bacterium]|nr:hypothetical protein [Phycisphaerales bacterium]